MLLDAGGTVMARSFHLDLVRLIALAGALTVLGAYPQSREMDLGSCFAKTPKPKRVYLIKEV